MIVVGAPVVAYLVLPGERTAAVERVYERDPEWSAPLHWRAELQSVLAFLVRRHALELSGALASFERAERVLGGREYVVAPERVLELAARTALGARDCELVALAEELAVPLVTSDARLIWEFPHVAVPPERFAAGR